MARKIIIAGGKQVEAGGTYVKASSPDERLAVEVVREDGTINVAKEQERYSKNAPSRKTYTADEFVADFVSSDAQWVQNLNDKAHEFRKAQLDEQRRREAVNAAHTQALMMDMLVDVSRGSDVEDVFSRLTVFTSVIIDETRTTARADGYDAGYDDGASDSYDYM